MEPETPEGDRNLWRLRTRAIYSAAFTKMAAVSRPRFCHSTAFAFVQTMQ